LYEIEYLDKMGRLRVRQRIALNVEVFGVYNAVPKQNLLAMHTESNAM
jgi:hypothetical protein